MIRFLQQYQNPVRFSLSTALALFALISTQNAVAAPEVSGGDAFDASNGTEVISHNAIIDPINVFRTSGGFEDGHTLMSSPAPGSESFIEFRTANRVALSGVRLFAQSDPADCCQRRSMSGFTLLADTDGDGTYETTFIDTDISTDYVNQPDNESASIGELILTLKSTDVVTSRNWRLVVDQEMNQDTIGGVRLVELDAIECIDHSGDGWGWDGEESCYVGSESLMTGGCIDDDGDGFGWNGAETCLISEALGNRLATGSELGDYTTSWHCENAEFFFNSDGSGAVVHLEGEEIFDWRIEEDIQQLSMFIEGELLETETIAIKDGELYALFREQPVSDGIEVVMLVDSDGNPIPREQPRLNCRLGKGGGLVQLMRSIRTEDPEGWSCQGGQKWVFSDHGTGTFGLDEQTFDVRWFAREGITIDILSLPGAVELTEVEFPTIDTLTAVDETDTRYNCQKISFQPLVVAPWNGDTLLFLPISLGDSFTLSLALGNDGNAPLTYSVTSTGANLEILPATDTIAAGETAILDAIITCVDVRGGSSAEIEAAGKLLTINYSVACSDSL